MAIEEKEKLELLSLIKERWAQINANFSQPGVTKHTRAQQWNEIWNQCRARGHKWTMQKDAKALSSSVWPTILDNYNQKQKRRRQTGSGGETRLTNIDMAVIDIIGKDSPDVKGALVPESGEGTEAEVAHLQTVNKIEGNSKLKRKLTEELSNSEGELDVVRTPEPKKSAIFQTPQIKEDKKQIRPVASTSGLKEIGNIKTERHGTMDRRREVLMELEIQNKQLEIKYKGRQWWFQELQIADLESKLGLDFSNSVFEPNQNFNHPIGPFVINSNKINEEMIDEEMITTDDITQYKQ